MNTRISRIALALLFGAIATIALPASSSAKGTFSVFYRVMLDKNVCMGVQSVEVALGNKPETAVMVGRIKLRFTRTIPITVEQDWMEVWEDGVLIDFNGAAYENHMHERMHKVGMSRDGEKLKIVNDGQRVSNVMRKWVPRKQEFKAPGNAVPASFWHEKLIIDQLEFFGPMSGTPHTLKSAAVLQGEDQGQVNGQPVKLRRYALTWKKKDQRLLWYTDDGLLFRYQHPSRGRTVTYTRADSAAAAECPSS